ncbi:MAG: alpha/beta hydrolase [Pseudomonadota bacterium]
MKFMLEGKTICYGTGSVTHDSLSADSPAIVFIHGAGFDHSVWVMPARYFARHGFRVVAPDLPAHGASEGPPLASIGEMARWLNNLLNELQINSATIVGHSMGSLVAMSYAAQFPAETQKLAFLGASAPMPVGPVLLDAAQDNSPAAFAMANTWSHSHPGGLGASATPGMSNFVSGARWLQRMQPGVYYHDLAACNEFEPVLPDMPKAVLVINGAQDKMTPARNGLALASALKDVSDQQSATVQTVTLAGCGHSMLSERHNEVLDALTGLADG